MPFRCKYIMPWYDWSEQNYILNESILTFYGRDLINCHLYKQSKYQMLWILGNIRFDKEPFQKYTLRVTFFNSQHILTVVIMHTFLQNQQSPSLYGIFIHRLCFASKPLWVAIFRFCNWFVSTFWNSKDLCVSRRKK